MKLTKENIRKIKFRGKKIMTLTKISEWDNPNNMNIYSESWFEEFIAWVFGLELEILTKEQVLEFFKSETFEEWMNLAVGGIGGITF
jgi:hypothetical protein